VSLDLAHDRRRGVRGKVTARRFEAVDRLDQADRPDLHEILDPLAAVCEPAREGACQREVRLDQPLASGEVTVVTVRAVQRRGLCA
jgi:hypothetical protein